MKKLMRKLLLFTAAALLLTGPRNAPAVSAMSAAPKTGKSVVGYYAGWSAYKGYGPEDIPAGRLTHLNYAFAGIDPATGSIALTDPEMDLENFEGIRALKKKNPGLRTLISVGGWDGSAHFSTIAASEQSRNAFADSCVSFLVTHGFDGVDLDWEYPVSGGPAGMIGSPADKQNFTLLLAAIRQKLDAQTALDGKKYDLTIAAAASAGYLNKIEPQKVAGLVDHIFVMAYDMHGPWDAWSDFGSPLYAPSGASPQYKSSVSDGIAAHLAAGIPAERLVLGMPLYGYVYQGVSAENQGQHSAYASAKAYGYDKIKSAWLNRPGYTLLRHAEARVPYLYGNSTFITYEDSRSIREKAALAGSLSLGGVGFWELSQNADGELLDSALAGLKDVTR